VHLCCFSNSTISKKCTLSQCLLCLLHLVACSGLLSLLTVVTPNIIWPMSRVLDYDRLRSARKTRERSAEESKHCDWILLSSPKSALPVKEPQTMRSIRPPRPRTSCQAVHLPQASSRNDAPLDGANSGRRYTGHPGTPLDCFSESSSPLTSSYTCGDALSHLLGEAQLALNHPCTGTKMGPAYTHASSLIIGTEWSAAYLLLEAIVALQRLESINAQGSAIIMHN
jgi:hypothetical protein